MISCTFPVFLPDLDYVTPFMVPTTFEGLIHEVIGIDNGIIELPNAQKDDAVPAKLNLSSSNISSFKVALIFYLNQISSWT